MHLLPLSFIASGVDVTLDAPREPRSFDYAEKFTELINRKKNDASCVIAQPLCPAAT